MINNNIRKLTRTAMMAAMVCVATMVIHIPSPINGYVNLGDCFVLLSGWMLGPWLGFFAGGVGSAMADLLLGYAYYAPGSFLIKGFVALFAKIIYDTLSHVSPLRPTISQAVSGCAAESFMVLGYFGYAALLLGKGIAAAASIPGNIIQGVSGIVIAVLLSEIFKRVGLMKKINKTGEKYGK